MALLAWLWDMTLSLVPFVVFGYLTGMAVWVLIWGAVLVLAQLAKGGALDSPLSPETLDARQERASRMLRRSVNWVPAAAELLNGSGTATRGSDDPGMK